MPKRDSSSKRKTSGSSQQSSKKGTKRTRRNDIPVIQGNSDDCRAAEEQHQQHQQQQQQQQQHQDQQQQQPISVDFDRFNSNDPGSASSSGHESQRRTGADQYPGSSAASGGSGEQAGSQGTNGNQGGHFLVQQSPTMNAMNTMNTMNTLNTLNANTMNGNLVLPGPHQNPTTNIFIPQAVSSSLALGGQGQFTMATGFPQQHQGQFINPFQAMLPAQGMMGPNTTGTMGGAGMNQLLTQQQPQQQQGGIGTAMFIPGVGLVTVINPGGTANGGGMGSQVPTIMMGQQQLQQHQQRQQQIQQQQQQQQQQQPFLVQSSLVGQQFRLPTGNTNMLLQQQQQQQQHFLAQQQQQQQQGLLQGLPNQHTSGGIIADPSVMAIQQDQHIHPQHLRPQQPQTLVLQQNLQQQSQVSGAAASSVTGEDQHAKATTNEDSSTSDKTQRRVSLHIQTDNDVLSDYQILLRKNIEFFEATRKDLDTITPGRKKPIVMGQVGIRCIHCVTNPIYRRTSASVYFPAKLRRLYQSAQNIGLTHFEQSCEKIGDDLRNKLKSYHDSGRKAAAGHGGKEYWTTAAKAQGIIETDSGLRFKSDDDEQDLGDEDAG